MIDALKCCHSVAHFGTAAAMTKPKRCRILTPGWELLGYRGRRATWTFRRRFLRGDRNADAKVTKLSFSASDARDQIT